MPDEKLSEIMLNLLERQVCHELQNMYKYQKIAMWLNVKGFTNLSKYFKEWSLEEKDHSMWVQEFLEGLNIFLDFVPTFENVQLDDNFKSFLPIVIDTENLTTEYLNECLAQSYKETSVYKYLVTEFILNKMLKEQAEETDKALTLKDKVENMGNDLAEMQILDFNWS